MEYADVMYSLIVSPQSFFSLVRTRWVQGTVLVAWVNMKMIKRGSCLRRACNFVLITGMKGEEQESYKINATKGILWYKVINAKWENQEWF